jgi:hypothetical protein
MLLYHTSSKGKKKRVEGTDERTNHYTAYTTDWHWNDDQTVYGKFHPLIFSPVIQKWWPQESFGGYRIELPATVFLLSSEKSRAGKVFYTRATWHSARSHSRVLKSITWFFFLSISPSSCRVSNMWKTINKNKNGLLASQLFLPYFTLHMQSRIDLKISHGRMANVAFHIYVYTQKI